LVAAPGPNIRNSWPGFPGRCILGVDLFVFGLGAKPCCELQGRNIIGASMVLGGRLEFLEETGKRKEQTDKALFLHGKDQSSTLFLSHADGGKTRRRLAFRARIPQIWSSRRPYPFWTKLMTISAQESTPGKWHRRVSDLNVDL